MKLDYMNMTKMFYNISIGSQHTEVLGAVGGSVGQRLEVVAMDRLNNKVSRRKHVQDVGAAKDWYKPILLNAQEVQITI